MSDYSSISFKNNGKLKLLIIVGTRPEIIRLAAVINKTRKYFDVILAHTGQNYDYNLNGVFFHDLQLADPEVYMNAVGADLGETMGNIISESYKLMAAIRYAKKHHIPFTNYVLDLWPENLYSVLPVKNRFMRWVAQSVSDSLYRRCDRLIAMSGPLQERLCARTGKSTADVAVIPQYCEDFYAVPQHDAALEAQFAGRFNVVFTGTFTPAQSLDMVIRAVLDARGAGAEHLHLLLVGDGMSREALQKQAADLHAGDAVTFYGSGPAADVPRFTALADALLISLSDSPDLGLTVPGKLASYMAAAKPVLASMNGAGYAAVLESGGGLVSPACDQKALADNMLALYRMTDAERAALGAKAKAYYTAHYRRAELLKRLEEFTVKGV